MCVAGDEMKTEKRVDKDIKTLIDRKRDADRETEDETDHSHPWLSARTSLIPSTMIRPQRQSNQTQLNRAQLMGSSYSD